MTRRIEFKQHGLPEVLDFVEFSCIAPNPHQVQVRNKAVGLNFIDTYFRNGLYEVPAFPSGLGFEGAGLVQAVGSAVTRFKPGDRVAYATGPLGAYSDVHTLPEDNLVHLPKSISFEEAAALMLKGLTVQYLFRQTYRLKAGEIILFHAAAGGVGTIACQWAKALGAKLIGTVSSQEKAAIARSAGAWEAIVYREEDVAERVMALTGGQKCPAVYDGVGKDTWETSLNCLAPRGLMVSFGNASGAVKGVDLSSLAQKGSLYVTRPGLPSYANSADSLQIMANELFAMIDQGHITADIRQRYSLADARFAHEALSAQKTTGSTVLLP
ncbi:NADPH:quinone reductase [Pseudomonas sp. MYb193]|uniref:NADPH:quinone reductase n=1 Tax=Pseudomonas sp. MYb193 TaxID=1827300 RepID=UPI000CF68C03|nr:NADPH:quinone reductase [Pseudomonas sp. MYb193]AVJ25582.1 quinone oxidoreductase [Pseudomonas sp. MYb193]